MSVSSTKNRNWRRGAVVAIVSLAVIAGSVYLNAGRRGREASRSNLPASLNSGLWQQESKWAFNTAPLDRLIQDPKIVAWRYCDPLEPPLAQFETVFWDPSDTVSLRTLIFSSDLSGKRVLEIGSGTGLISLCCLAAGCDRVIATDINPLAVLNTKYNADQFGWGHRIDARQVPIDNRVAFSNIAAGEMFDLIISNPPWENDVASSMDQFALYDENFLLLSSILARGMEHLNPGGKLWLVYGAQEPIKILEKSAPRAGWNVLIRDDRDLSKLPEVFVPGALIELTRPSR